MISLFDVRVLRLLLAVGALGFIVSHPVLLGWLGSQAPWYAFALWYVVFFAFVSFIGLTILPGKFRVRHAVGLLLLWFAFSPILGWVNNPYLSEKITGATVTGVEAGPEETILTWLWLHVTGDVGVLILLVYVLTPVLFVFLALMTMKPEPFFRMIRRLVL